MHRRRSRGCGRARRGRGRGCRRPRRGGGEAPRAAPAAAAAAAAARAARATPTAARTPRPTSAAAAEEADADASTSRGGRPARAARAAAAAAPPDREELDEAGEDRVAEGVVELLANGSGFVRVSPPEPSDDDVYVSAAQVRRCELVSGDKVAGPVRAPRRSERYPSLVRIDTINGRPADEVAEGTPFDDLPAGCPTERFALGGDDPTLKAIEWLTPIGRGSRVTIVGAARAGKTEALRRLAGALAGQDGLEVTSSLAGRAPRGGAPSGARAARARRRRCRSPPAPTPRARPSSAPIDTATRIAARGGARRRAHRHARRPARRRPPAGRWPPRATSSTAAR